MLTGPSHRLLRDRSALISDFSGLRSSAAGYEEVAPRAIEEFCRAVREANAGGVWDNVLSITLIDGRGDLRELSASHPQFPWLFGSMGQLGIFVEATLAIVPLAGAAPYPQGVRLYAPQLVERHVPLEFASKGDERLFWFTLFVPDEQLAQAQAELLALEARHREALRFAERYCYPIRYRGRVAPLVYPEPRHFTATGAWAC